MKLLSFTFYKLKVLFLSFNKKKRDAKYFFYCRFTTIGPGVKLQVILNECLNDHLNEHWQIIFDEMCREYKANI